MSPPSPKKRKANSLERSHTPSKKQRSQSSSANNESLNPGSSTLVSDEVLFTLECPARKITKGKKKKQVVEDDVFGPEQEDGGFPNLLVNYKIRPGQKWADLRRFSNFSIQNQKFPTGSLVYINKHNPPPAPPGPDASESEVLAFDKKNQWVGQVLEVKAANSSEVWLRVFWLYWPEELPKGRKGYHGNQELIMSNHMEIVDAKSVTSGADISHWDEKDEDQDVGHRFWRQFYDVQHQGMKSGGLSEIRRHCICGQYYNPDRTMLKCPNPKCDIWNHQECLEQSILEQTYRRLVDVQDPEKSNTKYFPSSKIAQLKSAKTSSKGKNGRKPKGVSTKVWLSNVVKHSAPWKGLLNAEISVGEKGAGGALVTITDDRAQDPEIWTESIQCLKCGIAID